MFKSRQQKPDETPARPSNVARPEDGSEVPAGQSAQVEEIELSEQAADLVKQLQSELDEAVEARKRALADFRNYQRRAAESEERALQTGSQKVVKAILPVLDHFDLALMQKAEQMTV